MKKTILTFATVLLVHFSFGQSEAKLQKIAAQIVEKAMAIYELESAAWTATDIVLAKPDFDKRELDGYVCYKMDSNTVCIFYSKSDTVLAELLFSDNQFIKSTYDKRPCNRNELRVVGIKRSVQDKLKNETIKKINVEPGTMYNIVPMVNGDDNFCYLINVVSSNSKTIFGRDYAIKLDANFNIVEVNCNHKSIQELPFKVDGITAFYHTHILEDFFSETEIATTLLYKKFLPTDKFLVMGRRYTSSWNSTTKILTIK